MENEKVDILDRSSGVDCGEDEVACFVPFSSQQGPQIFARQNVGRPGSLDIPGKLGQSGFDLRECSVQVLGGQFTARTIQFRSQNGPQQPQIEGQRFAGNVQARQQRRGPSGVFGKQGRPPEGKGFAEVVEVVAVILATLLPGPFPTLFKLRVGLEVKAGNALSDRLAAFREDAAGRKSRRIQSHRRSMTTSCVNAGSSLSPVGMPLCDAWCASLECHWRKADSVVQRVER